jgi:hypothetical protein
VLRLCEFYSGIFLTSEEKARKNLGEGTKNLSQVKKDLSQSTVYILPKHSHYLVDNPLKIPTRHLATRLTRCSVFLSANT